jgi:hypothetical protein
VAVHDHKCALRGHPDAQRGWGECGRGNGLRGRVAAGTADMWSACCQCGHVSKICLAATSRRWDGGHSSCHLHHVPISASTSPNNLAPGCTHTGAGRPAWPPPGVIHRGCRHTSGGHTAQLVLRVSAQ